MIKFLDLNKMNKPYETAFQEKLKSVLAVGWYILGKEVEQFETNFAQYSGVQFCIVTGNGLDALTLIFKGYIQLGKLQKGDEVIVQANTYIASILAIVQADLVPVLVEPKLDTYNIDPSLILGKVTAKTKAVLVVHLYGQLGAMDTVNEISKLNNLIVVEDAAQAHGAKSPQTPEGGIKEYKKAFPSGGGAAYSFYPEKNLGALGDGGAVITNDAELAKTIQSLRNYGSEIKNNKITLPFWNLSNNHVFYLFVIRTQNRDDLQNYLGTNNIETVIHYPIPPHKQKAFSEWNNLSFSITEKTHHEVLSLPISPAMTMDEVNYAVKIINKY
jgi:dTDP-4-amino-4,6-dideoxygalactose transaminase